MYRDYQKLPNQTFRAAEFVKELSGKNVSKYCAKFSKQASPCSQKTYQEQPISFCNKEIRKSIMTCSSLLKSTLMQI